MTDQTIRVGIVGATGYTAAEAARLVIGHPNASLAVATSRNDAGRPLGQVHRGLMGTTDVALSEFDADQFAEQCDAALVCLPHGASSTTVRQLVERGVRTVDFSADFRLSSIDLYHHHYGDHHGWPERVGSTVYGLPELFSGQTRTQMEHADLVANPGCYPTSAILPLSPLVAAGAIEPTDVIIDSKSGVSGAGRTPKLATLYGETNENFVAYGVGTHRHGPEIIDLVQRFSGVAIESIFTPHLVPMMRGILSTIYVRPTDGVDGVREELRSVYANSPMVHVIDDLPGTAEVARTNQVRIAVRSAGDRTVIVCVIDNLVKGASGAAIQNLNLMYGLDQTTGLI